jgi:hypothetical protein
VGIRLNKHKPNIYFKVRPYLLPTPTLSVGLVLRGLWGGRTTVSATPSSAALSCLLLL